MTVTKSESLVREADILADCHEDVRSLLKFYLMRAKDLDPHHVYEIDSKPLNTLYWLTAHLAWSEHFLLVEALGGEVLSIPWLDQFEMGTEAASSTNLPTFDEVRDALDQVHSHAMKTVRSLSSDDLDQENVRDLSFRGGNAKRVVIRHAIRHEPCHIGQIGWLIKAAGGETV